MFSHWGEACSQPADQKLSAGGRACSIAIENWNAIRRAGVRVPRKLLHLTNPMPNLVNAESISQSTSLGAVENCKEVYS